MQVISRHPVTRLELDTLASGRRRRAQQKPQPFTLIAFYRGLHGPKRKLCIGKLDCLADDFVEQGVNVVAVSSDVPMRAGQTKRDWNLKSITLGYGLPSETARNWGMFISRGRGVTSAGIDEPLLFNEPGVFLMRSDGMLNASAVNSMPFARPHFRKVLSAIDFIVGQSDSTCGRA